MARSIVLMLLVAVVSLNSIGVLMLYSAAQGDMGVWANKHLIRMVLGLIMVCVIAKVPFSRWRKFSYIFYGVGIALLLTVDILGHVGMGARRWISVGGLNLQPSELVKVLMIVVLAQYFTQVQFKQLQRYIVMVIPGLIIALPVVFALRQPSLGSAVIFIFIGV